MRLARLFELPGVPECMVQRMFGHRDLTSTRRSAKLADEALIYALQDLEGEKDLSPS